ncbi:thiol:disulfide interchange protein [uncultured Maricaulis sp.]|uniref:thiol:disulfide interchange protein n=1 Tax=uncultured Maricaulis sp. TaxID=174710 RepID=UPI0026042EEE|nr:thiol:disulfide interchange protein [uncultured Maricaulis sp.]
MRGARFIAWLAVLGLVSVLGWRYLADPAPAPTEPLPGLEMASLEGRAEFDPNAIEGVWLLNVWGSWCAPCHAEHPVLMALRSEGIAIYGLNWRDTPEDARQFLDDLGNPFIGVMQDVDNASVTALGISGAPETLVIRDGEIHARWPGPLTADALRNAIYPALERASRD